MRPHRLGVGGLNSAKYSNSRPQDQNLAILVGMRTRVRFRVPPPIPKIPTLIGWDFFCPFPQCWRGFRAWPRERHPSEVGVFAPTDASPFSVFSGGHASVLEVISFAGAGLEAVGCGWQLLKRWRPSAEQPQKNRPQAVAGAGCDALTRVTRARASGRPTRLARGGASPSPARRRANPPSVPRPPGPGASAA